ncbi:MAG: tetratricopeptide repeat protein [Verrucomicrobia bacterium]|nr:tetratricopeptide repeat protein [Verrucomicrobiota bacterium]
MQIFERLNDPARTARSLKLMGDGYYNNGQYDSAIESYNRSIDICSELEKPSKVGYLLVDIAYVYNEIPEFNNAIETDLKAVEVFNEAGDRAGLAKAYKHAGYNYWQQGSFSEAKAYYQKALEHYEYLGDIDHVGRLLNNIGTCHYGLNEYTDALEYFRRSLAIEQEESAMNSKRSVLILNNIGLIYQEWSKLADALEYHQRALDKANKIEYNFGVAYSQMNLGEYYRNNNQIEKALEYYGASYTNYVAGENHDSQSLVLRHVGTCYEMLGNHEKAVEKFRVSLEIADRIKNVFHAANAQYRLGKAYLDIGEPTNAEKYLNESLNNAESMGYNGLIKDNYYMLSRLEESRGNTNKAFDYYKRATKIKNEIFNEDTISKFTDLQVRYSVDQIERENQILRTENRIQQLELERTIFIQNSMIVGSLFLMVIIGLIINRERTLKNANKTLERQNNLIGEMNGHKEQLIKELRKALDNVKTLQKLIPICSSCKKIRDDEGYWNELESFIGKNADVRFSHGICPDCAKRLYPEHYGQMNNKKADGEDDI